MVKDEFLAGEHCPNHVLERLASGIPLLLGRALGGQCIRESLAKLLSFIVSRVATECRQRHVLDDPAVR